MTDLESAPNIGKVLKEKLLEAGISSLEELKSTGSEQAFLRIRTLHDSEDGCINMLYALEGAIQGIRWHGLPKERKAELKEFLKLLFLQNKPRIR